MKKTYLVTCQYYTSIQDFDNSDVKPGVQQFVVTCNKEDIITASLHEAKKNPFIKDTLLVRFLITSIF